MRQNLVVRSANVARILLDGVAIGVLQNVRPSDDYGPEAASGIGDIHAVEYVPTMARHTLSVSALALRKTSLYRLGIIPENGEEVLKGNVFDIEVYDKETGTVLRKYMSCSYASGDIEISKHAIIAHSATFYALDAAGTL
ncbi:MAG: hypothetical protein ABFD98_05040 [Syntrophobacteraceae bacterium]